MCLQRILIMWSQFAFGKQQKRLVKKFYELEMGITVEFCCIYVDMLYGQVEALFQVFLR